MLNLFQAILSDTHTKGLDDLRGFFKKAIMPGTPIPTPFCMYLNSHISPCSYCVSSCVTAPPSPNMLMPAGLVTLLEQRQSLWVEMLFWKTPEDCDEIVLGEAKHACVVLCHYV